MLLIEYNRDEPTTTIFKYLKNFFTTLKFCYQNYVYKAVEI